MTTLALDAEELNSTAATGFTTDNRGFSCTVVRDKKSLVFFSVPYDEGWSATVDGKRAEIEKVNVGFMAVVVEPGTSVIRFDYTTPGLDAGIYITLVSIIVFLIYFIICGIHGSRRSFAEPRYPEGEKLLGRWRREELAKAVSENLSAQDMPEDSPSLLDKLDGQLTEPSFEPPGGTDGGFTVNLNVFDDEQ